MVQYAKYIIFSFMILVGTFGLVSFGYENAVIKEARRFNAQKFKDARYTDEELSLFCDIAFMHEETRIRKWTKDIKVEIKNIADLDQKSIAEVDSVIAIFAPLIAPLKIERVKKDGNLHVYRKVSKVTSSKPKDQPRPKYLNGLAKTNRVTRYSSNITFACIYDGQHASSQTLIHEFEHALGLNHPIKLYPYYVTIGRSVIPQYFRSIDEIRAFYNQPFYLSEQEKTVIRMLYSPEIKSGLHIDLFAQKMGFSEDDKVRMIPNINKKPRIIVYPSEAN